MSDFENTFREEIEKAYNHGKIGALYDVDLSLYKAIASMQGEAVEVVRAENLQQFRVQTNGAWMWCCTDDCIETLGHIPSAASKIAEQDAEISRLQKELEEARKDAERYRWLRENYHGFEMFRNSTIPHVTLDREVDSAMKG